MGSHHHRRRRRHRLDHMQTQRSCFNFTIIISVPGPLRIRARVHVFRNAIVVVVLNIVARKFAPPRRFQSTHKIDIFIVWHTLKQLVPFYFYFDRFLFCSSLVFGCFCYCLVILQPLHTTTWMRHLLVL